jgi:hypothetical protein
MNTENQATPQDTPPATITPHEELPHAVPPAVHPSQPAAPEAEPKVSESDAPPAPDTLVQAPGPGVAGITTDANSVNVDFDGDGTADVVIPIP